MASNRSECDTTFSYPNETYVCVIPTGKNEREQRRKRLLQNRSSSMPCWASCITIIEGISHTNRPDRVAAYVNYWPPASALCDPVILTSVILNIKDLQEG